MASDRKSISLKLKKAVYEKYGMTCHLCGGAISALSGKYGPSLDHLIPVNSGGKNTLDNLRPAHRRCNSQRQDKGLDRHRAGVIALQSSTFTLLRIVSKQRTVKLGDVWLRPIIVNYSSKTAFTRYIRGFEGAAKAFAAGIVCLIITMAPRWMNHGVSPNSGDFFSFVAFLGLPVFTLITLWLMIKYVRAPKGSPLFVYLVERISKWEEVEQPNKNFIEIKAKS
jgi:hypothetical protein